MDPNRVLIALSGGVDSSVAAYLTVKAGFECAGATMQLFDGENAGRGVALPRDTLPVKTPDDSCCSSSEIEDARRVCTHLGIDHHVFNLTGTFSELVIERFVSEYQQGRTPNPCICCNRFLKFGQLPARARELGFSHISTGHYARIEYDRGIGRYLLKRGVDRNKDQSYVLYMLTQDQLEHTLLPLGEMTKEQVRNIAREQGFHTAEKEESQDICFIPDHDHGAFIRRYSGCDYQCGSQHACPPGYQHGYQRGCQPGNIINTQGKAIGTHQGIIDFTVGQRKGIGIAAAQPLYVTDIFPETATIVVGREPDLYRRTAIVEDINLIACDRLEQALKATAKHRYRSPEKPAMITQIDEGKLEVVFDEPQKAVTKGQALVIYDRDVVIGGGTITDVL